MWNDISIFRNGLLDYLDENERVEADRGYVGEDPMSTKTPKRFAKKQEKLKKQGKVHARHETVNKRFKQWDSLSTSFIHNIQKHSIVFHAISVVTKLTIEAGDKLFDVPEYNE